MCVVGCQMSVGGVKKCSGGNVGGGVGKFGGRYGKVCWGVGEGWGRVEGIARKGGGVSSECKGVKKC